MRLGDAVEVRSLRSDECEQVWKVDQEAFANSPFGEITGLKHWPEEKRKDWQSDPRFRAFSRTHPEQVLVAVAQGRIVGFATYEYFPEEQRGRVFNAAVLPECRGMGIGVALILRLLEEVRSLGARTAVVSTACVPAARRMYEKAGFKLVKRELRRTQEGRKYYESYYELAFAQ